MVHFKVRNVLLSYLYLGTSVLLVARAKSVIPFALNFLVYTEPGSSSLLPFVSRTLNIFYVHKYSLQPVLVNREMKAVMVISCK